MQDQIDCFVEPGSVGCLNFGRRTNPGLDVTGPARVGHCADGQPQSHEQAEVTPLQMCLTSQSHLTPERNQTSMTGPHLAQ